MRNKIPVLGILPKIYPIMWFPFEIIRSALFSTFIGQYLFLGAKRQFPVGFFHNLAILGL